MDKVHPQHVPAELILCFNHLRIHAFIHGTCQNVIQYFCLFLSAVVFADRDRNLVP